MSRRRADSPVIIVGAGPAGLVTAHLLHRAGIESIVLERHRREDLELKQAKAGSIDYRTVQMLTAEGLCPDVVNFDVENHYCEFRTPAEQVVFDYGAVTGGRAHFIYPQHLLVGRLGQALIEAGGDVRFGQAVTSVAQDADGVTATTADGSELRGEVVVGCDGARSAVAHALEGCEVVEEAPPVRLLAVLGEAPPLEPHTIYAGHPRGFAGQMRRSPTLTRYYLEVPSTDTLEDWPEDRIRQELMIRLLALRLLDGVRFIEPSFVDLRMRMTTPMQDRRLFVAGDAAHLITPAGGKGMNLAIHDAVELAHGLIDRFGPACSAERLAAYSATRLPVLWRTQAFSRWMLRLMLAGTDDPAAGPFGAGLKQGWVSALQHDPLLASWFAHAYAGVDPPSAAAPGKPC